MKIWEKHSIALSQVYTAGGQRRGVLEAARKRTVDISELGVELKAFINSLIDLSVPRLQKDLIDDLHKFDFISMSPPDRFLAQSRHAASVLEHLANEGTPDAARRASAVANLLFRLSKILNPNF